VFLVKISGSKKNLNNYGKGVFETIFGKYWILKLFETIFCGLFVDLMETF
jgi:hypothetical protein